MSDADHSPEDPQARPRAEPRDVARWVAERLVASGHRALFAGGCVRDRLLGLEPADYDVATDATPDQIRAVFPTAIGVGESFGVMLVRKGGRSVEVATFRIDGPYSDGRRPIGVQFATDKDDAQRRDFTINGLFEDPATGEIIDYVGGQADLRARTLRAIGDARERFSEDRLRTLRAVRFAARFGLAIEPRTHEAIRAFAQDLGAVSRERIGHEVRRMLAHPTRGAAANLCESLGLAAVMFNEPGCAWNSATLCGLSAQAEVPTALAGWMLGRCIEAQAGTVSPRATEPFDRARVAAWRKALLLSNEETELLTATLKLLGSVHAHWQVGNAAVRKRLAGQPVFEPVLQLIGATDPARERLLRQETATLAETGISPVPFVTGDDLVAAGMAPGPKFKHLLDRFYDRQLLGELTSRDQALAEVRALHAG